MRTSSDNPRMLCVLRKVFYHIPYAKLSGFFVPGPLRVALDEPLDLDGVID